MTNKTAINPFYYINNYYDLLYQDKDYKEEANYVAEVLKSFNPGTKNLLELGCGTGNYSQQFCKLDFTVTGIEISEQMCAMVEAKSLNNFSVVNSDITNFILDRQFDCCVALFHVVSYLTSNKNIIDCFTSVNKHLKPNSIFIFDIWYSPAVYIQSPQKRTKEIETNEISIKRVAVPEINFEENVVEVNYEIYIKKNNEDQSTQLTETHRLRHFSTPEIKLFAELCDFKFIRAEEFYTAKPPGSDTWGVCYILQKNG